MILTYLSDTWSFVALFSLLLQLQVRVAYAGWWKGKRAEGCYPTAELFPEVTLYKQQQEVLHLFSLNHFQIKLCLV